MSEKITVSGEKFISTLREVAAENPDYVYEAPDALTQAENCDSNLCYYVHPSPAGPVCGCIIGATLVRLGVPLDVLAKHERTGASLVMERLLNLTGPQARVASVMASATQNAQDGAYSDDGSRPTWADAVATGDVYAGTAVV